MIDKNIEEEILRTLESLNNIQRAEAPPFLATRIRARIANRENQNNLIKLLVLRPALSFGVLLVAMVMNVYMVSQVLIQKRTGSASDNSSMQAFAKEYGMISYSVYEKQQ